MLDFVNERDDLLKAFKPYYEATEIGEMPDVHQLYAIQHELEASPVIIQPESTQFCEIWFRNRREPTAGEHKQLNGILDQAVIRFGQLNDPDKEAFKSKLVSFRNLWTVRRRAVWLRHKGDLRVCRAAYWSTAALNRYGNARRD